MKLILLCFFILNNSYAESDLELIDQSDINILNESVDTSKNFDDLSIVQEDDDLNSLKSDLGVEISLKDEDKDEELKSDKPKELGLNSKKNDLNKNLKTQDIELSKNISKFNLGDEEKLLLDLLPKIGRKIPEEEWNEIAGKSSITSYKIEEGDTLWKISQKYFGTGFYYSKIWSLNSYIENPHQIEPGMDIIFSSGTSSKLPSVQLGKFKSNKLTDQNVEFSFDKFGENIRPKWIDERKKLIEDGKYFVYGSNQSYNDIKKLGSGTINYEYQKYEPPVSNIQVYIPQNNYDKHGFDVNDKIVFNIKSGFATNTFITSNIVQDFGEIVASKGENTIIRNQDHVYLKFDPSIKIRPGDQFSVYIPYGKIKSKFSDRSGFKYSIGANVRVLSKKENKWEAIVVKLFSEIKRGDRLTILTPKIPTIKKTYNKRKIEAVVLENFKGKHSSIAAEGDLVYLDRGRLDGVEFGNVFKIYGVKDKGLNKAITKEPTYETGEAVVITVTDNFSTALITNSSMEEMKGMLSKTVSYDEYLLAQNLRRGTNVAAAKTNKFDQLDNLDLDLNLSDVNRDLLEKADKIKLSEDELAELDRQEKEKSIIKGQEKDLEELNKIENEILSAKKSINESILDEDKYLEQQNLNQLEKSALKKDKNAFSSMDDLESEIGKKYLDEDINAEENPYGLTKFDIEDINQLLDKESKE